MRTVVIAAVLAAGTALATPAFAQDSDRGFTGPRVEGVVGWDRVSDGDSSNADPSDGVVYGIQAGYDYDLGTAVIGVEGEFTGSSIDESDTNVLAAGDTLTVKAGRDLYVGGRLGFKVGENALIYAKGGYTNARVETLYTAPATSISTKDDLDGWRLGAGAEVKIGTNLYLKGEYRYSNYDNLSGSPIDLDRHQVVGGVGVRF